MKKLFLLYICFGLISSACTTNHKSADFYPNYNLPKAQVVLAEDNFVLNYPEKNNKAYLKDEILLKRQIQDIKSEQVQGLIVYQPYGEHEKGRYVAGLLKQTSLNGKKVNILCDESLENQTILKIIHWKADVVNCPNWSKPTGTDYYNSNGVNFGCANEMNLATMVVNPHDVEAGRTLSKPDSHQPVMAIDRYRRGEIIDIRRQDGVLGTD